MRRRHSHAGFWAVVREARRRGWPLRGLSLRLAGSFRFAGVRWAMTQLTWIREGVRRRSSRLALAPEVSRTALTLRRELWKRMTALLKPLGYRPGMQNPREPGFTFEKSFDGREGSPRTWPRMLEAFEALPLQRGRPRAARSKASLVSVLRRLFRRGWQGVHLHADAPPRRCRAGLPWMLRTSLGWCPGEGIVLSFELDALKRVHPEELRRLRSGGLLERFARELEARGLESELEESLHEVWKGRPSPLTIYFSRDGIPPARVREAVDGLRDWRPTGEKGRGS